MKFISKKWQITIIILAVIAGGSFVLEHFVDFNPVTVAINTIASPVKHGFSYVSHSLNSVKEFVWDMRAYKEDNKRLASENIELKRENRSISEYKSENERLRKLLDLKVNSEEYTTVAAEVISFSHNDEYRRVEISKGTAAGIVKGNAVITADGLVGRVSEAGPNYAMVETILDPESIIGIKVSRSGGTGLVEGDYDLARNAQCKLTFVDKETPVIVGDVIETSGSGGAYPAGLVIGTVMNISADRSGTLNYAVIDTAVNFDMLREVLVITATE